MIEFLHAAPEQDAPMSGPTEIEGNGVVLRFNAGRPPEDAPALVRAAERIIDYLKKLIGPQDPPWSRMIYLEIGTPEAQSNDRRELPIGLKPDSDDLYVSVTHSIQSEPFARDITRALVTEWFGHDAVKAETIIEGIAGLAAASAGKGPSANEADKWVQNQISARKRVALSIRTQTERGDEEEINRAATSFISFLIAQSGTEPLREYLATYDPTRREHAAQEAYHEPLAVLEEEWLARLHRKGQNQETVKPFLKQIIPLLRPYKWKHIEILGYLILAAAYNVVQPYAVKVFIDRLSRAMRETGIGGAGDAFVTSILPLVLLLLGIYALNGAVSMRRAYTVSWLNQNILNELQIRLYSHLQRLSHSFYVNARIGDLMSRLNSDLDNVQQALSQVTNKALYRGFTVIGALTALVMLTRTSPILSVPILCIIPLFIVNYAALRTRNKQASREQRQRVGRTMSTVQEHLSAHAVIKAFGMEDRFISDYRSGIYSLQRSRIRLAMLSALTDLSEDLTTGLAQLVVIGVGGYLVLHNHGRGLGVGDLAALLVLVKSIFSPIASLAGIGQTMQQATGSMERVSEIFDEQPTVSEKEGAKPLPRLTREIRMENVCFKYGGNRPVIQDLTAVIPAGKHVAIVGPSGSGKSTIVNLLMRFWDPESGRVTFDGTDIRDVSLASLRCQVGLVFQETFVFNTTLRANIAIGRPDATDEEIMEAAAGARLDEFIRSLPAGLDTVPGELGARMSSGQKQRIAIARVFLRNPPVLILDEATSALDARTETEILDTLSDLSEGRTTISVTHRISQASSADVILVLDGGRLVEQGAHEELLKLGGLYRKLYDNAYNGVSDGNTADPVTNEPETPLPPVAVVQNGSVVK